MNTIIKHWGLPFTVAPIPELDAALEEAQLTKTSFAFWLVFVWLREERNEPRDLHKAGLLLALIPQAKAWATASAAGAKASLLAQRRRLDSGSDKMKLLLDEGCGLSALMRCDAALRYVEEGTLTEADVDAVMAKFKHDADVQKEGCPWLSKLCMFY